MSTRLEPPNCVVSVVPPKVISSSFGENLAKPSLYSAEKLTSSVRKNSNPPRPKTSTVLPP